ncbi:MAG: hypothetical protein CMK32_05225 [Porticoccaceae bacterium]|nr:hypothetical protein [Porticoccaceae bacterium]
MSNLGDVLRQVVCIPDNIPDDWSFHKLTKVCSPKQWRTVSSSEMTETGYPVFGANGFVGFYPEYNHADEAIAITCRGNTCGTINRIPPKTYITGNSMALDNVQSNVISQNYLYYALKYRGVGDSISGSAQPQITGAGLRAIEFPAPPLPEQQKIAAILSSVDDVIEKTRTQIDKLKDLKTGMMQELLTKGIGHTEFKDSPVGRIPAAWDTYSAKELLSRKILLGLQDGNHGSQYPRSSEFVKHGVPYIAASHISEFGEIDFSQCPHLSQDHANRLRIRPAQSGDVILTHNATVGRTAIIPDDKHEVIASTSTTYYRTDPTKLLNRYLVTYFQSTAFVSQLQAIMGQTTRNQVPITAQRELQIVLPPMYEQVAIATAIESVTIRIKMLRSKFDHLMLAKKALMQDLLTGKVRVNVDQKESAVA